MRNLKALLTFAVLVLFGTDLTAQSWNLVWQDEFNNGIGPDWVFETGRGASGWGNNELQYYRRENASVQNGALVITARRESFGGANYTSARMKTQGRKSWKYGKIEARIAMPSFQGVWPAFWMLGDNISSVGWPSCGEIDIMEHVNTGGEVVGTIHWSDPNGNHADYGGRTNTNITAYHTYAVEWDASSIKWFVDGIHYHTVNIANGVNGTHELHNNQFILLNMAIGGNWPGFSVDNNAFPANMYVDYVRVYQMGSNPPPPTGTATVYRDCNFSGHAVGLPVGDYNYGALYARGVANEDISSLRVNSGYEVVLYEHDNFGGASTVIKGENACLVAAGWNDRTTSLKVRAVTVNNPTGVSTVFRDCNYSGHAVALPVGDYNYGALYARGVANEDISSLRINSGYEIQLFEHDNFTGASITFSGDNACLVNQGWNDRTTSLKIRAATQSFSRTIQAESYSSMLGVQLENTADAGGGQNVGWIDAGDWMAYNGINIPYSGTYRVSYRVASQNGGGRLSLDLNAGSIQLGAINVPATGGWQTWTTISHNVYINAGTYNFGIYAHAGGFNLNWFSLTRIGGKNSAASEDVVYEKSLMFDYATEMDLDFYPNPATEYMVIKSAHNLIGSEYRIYDEMGLEVANSKLYENALDLSSLSPGLYTMIIHSNGNKFSKRFMKQ